MDNRNMIIFGIGLTIALTLACSIAGTPQEDNQTAFDTAVAQTSQAQFVEMTMQAQSSSLPPTAAPPTAAPPTTAPPTTEPPTIAAPTASADAFAPDPLGPAWSSMAFNGGTCYDLDVLFTANDATVDVCLDNNVLMTPQNGATISGNAELTTPSLNTCKAKNLTADPIAPNSDQYMCFQTNQGSYGFFVMRDDQMLASGYIVFDAYVFP